MYFVEEERKCARLADQENTPEIWDYRTDRCQVQNRYSLLPECDAFGFSLSSNRYFEGNIFTAVEWQRY